MSLLSPPQIPLFRITLFYGPEGVNSDQNAVYCVFNVKKRSWKGGIQVEVVLNSSQIQQLEKALDFQEWLKEVVSPIPQEDQQDFCDRGHDLFVQLICFHKLQALIGQGIRQENIRVLGEELISETVEAVKQAALEIKGQIITELDIQKNEDDCEEVSSQE